MSAVKYHWPEPRLRTLLTEPGGKTRSEALAGAAEALEECRDVAMEGVRESLGEIEAIVEAAGARDLTRDEVFCVLEHAERLAGVATPFQWPVLLQVTASLGLLGDALLDAAHRPAHPLAVHARAVRWALDHAESAEAEAGPMLAGLEKVAARYGAAGAQAAGPAA